MDFKQFYLLNESPDKMNGHPWHTNDSIVFFLSPSFLSFQYQNYPHVKHSDLFQLTYKEIQKQNSFILNTKFFNGNFSPLKTFFKENSIDRSLLMRISKHHNLNILIGRLWSDSKNISFWNSINELTIENLESTINFIENNLKQDAGLFSYEFFTKNPNQPDKPKEKQFSLTNLYNLLHSNNNTSSSHNQNDDFHSFHKETELTNTNSSQNWRNNIHTFSPEIKNQFLKLNNIKPQKVKDIRNNQYQESSSTIPDFKTFYENRISILTEMPMKIDSFEPSSFSHSINIPFNNRFNNYSQLGEFNINHINIQVYENTNSKNNLIQLVLTNNEKIIAMIDGQILPNNNFLTHFTQSAGKQNNIPFLLQNFYFKFLSQKYSAIISDDSLTPEGFKFWQNITANLPNNLHVYVAHFNTTSKSITPNSQQLIHNPNELSNYYKFMKDDNSIGNYRFILSSSSSL